MDALRKAEETKRAASQSSGEGIAVPATAADPPHASLADETSAALELAPLPPRDDVPQTQPAAPRRVADHTAQRQAVHNAFAAKATPKKPEDKAFMLALVCVATLAAVGIGTYVWWQMHPRGSLEASSAAPTATAPHPTAMAAPAVEASPRLEPQTAAAPVVHEAIARSAPPPAADSIAPAAADPVRITRSQPRVSPLLEQGYSALQQGRLPQAQQAYERMLASDPKSVDAMYGLAAIALQRQQPDLAEDYYLRILEADPRDPYAHAGLAGLRGRSGSSNAESRLKTLIAEQPGVAPLHFALGNLYAQDQRWRDAQQSYFLAYQNDSSNPDIAYNLAVSLDHLRQGKPAAQYYAEALRLATVQNGAFNREQVQQRLRELQAAGGS